MDKNYLDKRGRNTDEKWLLFIHSIIDEYRFSLYQFRVLCHLARRAGHFSVSCGSINPCRAGLRSMARHCGISVGTLRKTLAELVYLGVLERVVRGPGQVDHYFITPVCQWPPPETVARMKFGPNYPGGE